MTLNCSAYNCTYNQSGTCYAGKITISGTKATNSSNTHCSTFSESNGNLTNLSSNYFTTSNADSVHVNDSHVNCDTFIND